MLVLLLWILGAIISFADLCFHIAMVFSQKITARYCRYCYFFLPSMCEDLIRDKEQRIGTALIMIPGALGVLIICTLKIIGFVVAGDANP
jgi:hypothetical protein